MYSPPSVTLIHDSQRIPGFFTLDPPEWSYHDMSPVTVLPTPSSTPASSIATNVGPFQGQVPFRKPAPINPLVQSCHNCGADLSHSHIADDAQRRISELEAQVKILTSKATAAGRSTMRAKDSLLLPSEQLPKHNALADQVIQLTSLPTMRTNCDSSRPRQLLGRIPIQNLASSNGASHRHALLRPLLLQHAHSHPASHPCSAPPPPFPPHLDRRSALTRNLQALPPRLRLPRRFLPSYQVRLDRQNCHLPQPSYKRS